MGAQESQHSVSDGDAVCSHCGGDGIDLAYGRGAPHQWCVFHLLREYWRNLVAVGFAEAKRPLRSASLAEGRKWARRLVRLAAAPAAYLGARKHYPKGGGI